MNRYNWPLYIGLCVLVGFGLASIFDRAANPPEANYTHWYNN